MSIVKRLQGCLRGTHKFLSVPLRLAISILLLMIGGLVAMYGSAVLAQLMYGVVLPAIASQDDSNIDTTDLRLSREGVLFVSIFGAIMVVELTILVISIASTMFSHVGMASWFRDQWKTLLSFNPRLAFVPKHIPKRLRRLKNENAKDMVELSLKLEALGVTKTSHYLRDSDSTFLASINYMGMGTSQFVQVSQAMDLCERIFLGMFVVTAISSFIMCFVWAPNIVVSRDDISPPSSATSAMYSQPPSLSFDTYIRAFVMIFVVTTNFVLFFGLIVFLFYRAIWGLVHAVVGWCSRASMMNIYGLKRILLFCLFLVLTPVVFLIAPIPLLLYRVAVRTKILFKRHCTRTKQRGPMIKEHFKSTRVLEPTSLPSDLPMSPASASSSTAVHLPVQPSPMENPRASDDPSSDAAAGAAGALSNSYKTRVRNVWNTGVDCCTAVSKAYIRSMPLPDYADKKGDFSNVSLWTFLLFSASFNAQTLPRFLRCLCISRPKQVPKRPNKTGVEVMQNPTAAPSYSTFETVQGGSSSASPSASCHGRTLDQLEIYKREAQPVENPMQHGTVFILQLILGAGSSSWDNFSAFLTHINAWYLSLWFLGSLIHVRSYPQVCIALGILAAPALAVGIYNNIYQKRKKQAIRRENLWLRHLYALSPTRLVQPPRLNEQKYILKNLKVEPATGAGGSSLGAALASNNTIELATLSSPRIGNGNSNRVMHSSSADESANQSLYETRRISANPLANNSGGNGDPGPPSASASGPRVVVDAPVSANEIGPGAASAAAVGSTGDASSARSPATSGSGISNASAGPYVNPINPGYVGDALGRASRRQRLEYLKARPSQRQHMFADTDGAVGAGVGAGAVGGGWMDGGDVLPAAVAESAREASHWESEFVASDMQSRLKFIEREDFNPETAVEDTSVPCAWGALILGLCIVAALMSWAISVPMGISMSITLLFIIGNACLRRPSSSFASTTCRIILVLVAALYGVMTSALGESSAKGHLLAVGPDWTGIPTNPYEQTEAFHPPNVFNAQSNVYGTCGTRMNSLSPLDMCFMSASMYNDHTVRNTDIQDWFQKEGRTITPITLPPTRTGVTVAAFREVDDSFHPPSQSMYDLSTWGYRERIYVSIRGTKVARDVSQDALIWQESLLFKLLSTIGPFSSWPMSAVQTFIGFVGTVKYQFRGPWGHISYADEAVSIVKKLQQDYPNASFIVTGHSLGGGLSTIVGQRLEIPYVSFSGPGALYSAIKLGITNTKSLGLVYIPAYDVVPLIDVHTSAVQQLQCLNAASALSCHSITRTCCELRRACGDIGGHNRTLTACTKYV